MSAAGKSPLGDASPHAEPSLAMRDDAITGRMLYTKGDMTNHTDGSELIQPSLGSRQHSRRGGKLPPGVRRISRIPPRKIIVCGRPTSIRLEPDFWQWLKEIAFLRQCTVRALIDAVAASSPQEPLSSLLRSLLQGSSVGGSTTSSLINCAARAGRARPAAPLDEWFDGINAVAVARQRWAAPLFF
jgi:predicted DNA-binding ribbon-helix-helix protein